MAGITTACGTILRGCSMRMVENHCLRGLVCLLFLVHNENILNVRAEGLMVFLFLLFHGLQKNSISKLCDHKGS